MNKRFQVGLVIIVSLGLLLVSYVVFKSRHQVEAPKAPVIESPVK